MRLCCLLAVAFALLLVANASATTIVIIRTRTHIVIASDSKAQYQGDQGAPQVCKIAKQNETYFVVAGLARDTYRGYLASRTIASAIARGQTLDEQANAVEADMLHALTTELTQLRTDDQPGFNFAVSGEAPSSIALVTMEAGIPKVVVFSFLYDKATGKLTSRRDSCPGTCTGDDFIIQLGRALSEEEVSKVTGSASRMAKTLVELEIQRDPTNVGPPVELVELRTSGPEWLQDDLNCAAESNVRKKYPHSVTIEF